MPMENEFWLNLSSKDLQKSREFFTKLGFTMNTKFSGSDMVSMFIGNKKTVLNLFPEKMLQGFMNQPVTDASKSNEIIFSIGAATPGEVDELARKAVEAGANLFAKPGYKDGWMYGCGFADLDGHRWNILFMDIIKMPKA